MDKTTQKGNGLFTQSMADFFEKTASANPTPGGGSISAVTALAAVSMVSMNANLTVNKKKYSQYREKIQNILTGCKEITAMLMGLTRADIEVFNNLMAAWKKGKDSAEFKKSLIDAARIPLEIASAGLRILQLAGDLAPVGNVNAISDVGVAAYLAKAAVNAAILNVDINLERITDEKIKKDFMQKKMEILKNINELETEIIKIAGKRISGDI